jgi:hypothetical protein
MEKSWVKKENEEPGVRLHVGTTKRLEHAGEVPVFSR